MNTTTDQIEGTYRAVLENPNDEGMRLICADAYEDAGETERAEFIRVQCELAKIGPRWQDSIQTTLNERLPDSKHVGGGEFIMDFLDRPPIGARVDTEAVRLKNGRYPKRLGLRVTSTRLQGEPGFQEYRTNAVWDEYSGEKGRKQIRYLHDREVKLFSAHAADWISDLPGGKEGPVCTGANRVQCGFGPVVYHFNYQFVKGFVEVVTCTSYAWLCVHQQLIPQKNVVVEVNGTRYLPQKPLPIREVHLTTVPDWRIWGPGDRVDIEDEQCAWFSFKHWRGVLFRVLADSLGGI